VNKLLTYDLMLDSIIVAYIQYVIMLIELQMVLSQDLKCLVAILPQSYIRINCT
jgi:hypothetical protein